MFRAVHDSEAWSVDLEQGQLEIGGRTFGAQLLGTHAQGSDTFLWSWANPGATGWSRDVVEAATMVRARSARPGNAVFREAKIAAGWVNPYELTWVTGELAGGLPIFAGTHAGTTAFVAVSGGVKRLDPERLPGVFLPGVILDLQTFIAADPRTCVRVFAKRLGFEVEEDASALRGRRADCAFTTTFDAQGRPARVEIA
jgi:hypothetical protein